MFRFQNGSKIRGGEERRRVKKIDVSSLEPVTRLNSQCWVQPFILKVTRLQGYKDTRYDPWIFLFSQVIEPCFAWHIYEIFIECCATSVFIQSNVLGCPHLFKGGSSLQERRSAIFDWLKGLLRSFLYQTWHKTKYKWL